MFPDDLEEENDLDDELKSELKSNSESEEEVIFEKDN